MRSDERVPIQLQRVSRHDIDVAESAIRNPQSAIICQSAIPLDRDDALHARGENDRQGARSRSDLEDDVAGRGLERVDDLREELRVAEEVLPERRPPAHTLRITRVRSSAAGAPPVKPARSA